MVILAFPASMRDSTSAPAARRRFVPSQSGLNMTDEVRRAQEGNADAFSELYARHKKRVFALCMQMVRDPSLAEDLAQDTFLQVHRKLASFRGESAFTTWLHRLCVNTVLMHLRKRVLQVVSLDQMMTTVPEEHTGREFGTRDLTQAGVVDRLSINRAIASLAPGYRCIFILHDIEGLAHYEIAALQGCSMGNSKSQLYKARRAMRDNLSASGGAAAGTQAVQVEDSAL
jgi:RNA polymerase sigma-70 factor, ECF subfamily